MLSVGYRGYFALDGPFNTIITNKFKGEVVGLASIQTLVARGMDILNEVYLLVDEQLYYEHLEKDVVIVTIKTSSDDPIQVPLTHLFIAKEELHEYIGAYLTVRVGRVPIDYDFIKLQETMAKEITTVTGVVVETDDVVLALSPNESQFLTADEAEHEEALRLAAVENNPSDYARLRKQIEENDLLKERITALEAKIISLGVSV